MPEWAWPKGQANARERAEAARLAREVRAQCRRPRDGRLDVGDACARARCDLRPARRTSEALARFERLEAEYLADLVRNGCEDAAQATRKAMCGALGLARYVELIWAHDTSMNPVVVEDYMRAQYGTLGHLSRETFEREVANARQHKEREPEDYAWYGATVDECAGHTPTWTSISMPGCEAEPTP